MKRYVALTMAEKERRRSRPKSNLGSRNSKSGSRDTHRTPRPDGALSEAEANYDSQAMVNAQEGEPAVLNELRLNIMREMGEEDAVLAKDQ